MAQRSARDMTHTGVGGRSNWIHVGVCVLQGHTAQWGGHQYMVIPISHQGSGHWHHSSGHRGSPVSAFHKGQGIMTTFTGIFLLPGGK